MRPQHHVFRGKRWRIMEVDHLTPRTLGDCESPTTADKAIRIASSLTDPKRLEILLHETLHACLWDLDDETITETARDIASCLCRQGYRRDKG